jgi:hypothetical protein
MNDVEKRTFSMRISFLWHLTEAMHETLKMGQDIPEESIEKLKDVSTLVYQQHRRNTRSET